MQSGYDQIWYLSLWTIDFNCDSVRSKIDNFSQTKAMFVVRDPHFFSTVHDVLRAWKPGEHTWKYTIASLIPFCTNRATLFFAGPPGVTWKTKWRHSKGGKPTTETDDGNRVKFRFILVSRESTLCRKTTFSDGSSTNYFIFTKVLGFFRRECTEKKSGNKKFVLAVLWCFVFS